MLKIFPLVEGFVLANIATRNLFGAGPLEFLLGDLNQNVGANPNMLQLAMGPSGPTSITLKEILTNSMDSYVTTTTTPQAGGKSYTQNVLTQGQGGVIDAVTSNFMNNMGNIIIGTVASTAGFRIAKKVLRKPINMANRQLRNAGLGGTVQF